MKKNILTCFGILLGISMYAQVGIGTTDPQQELHVAGSESTIRYDYLNSTNSPFNDGIKLSKVYVSGVGDIILGHPQANNSNLPLNFLIENFNFVNDDPYDLTVSTGSVINNTTNESSVEEVFRTIDFTVPSAALIEIKYGITYMIRGSDISIGPPYTPVAYDQSIKIGTFFCIDIDGDGLSTEERNKMYGHQGQYYETQYGGIDGFSYLNTQGYLLLPEGNHRIYFFGVIDDYESNYTSVGYGGGMDYLKIRIYN